MKIRNGFVSNSSSSSFVLKIDEISEDQLAMIWDHIELGRDLLEWQNYHDEDRWSIWITEDHVHGETSMDNFDMYEFLIKIGIDKTLIKMYGSY